MSISDGFHFGIGLGLAFGLLAFLYLSILWCYAWIVVLPREARGHFGEGTK